LRSSRPIGILKRVAFEFALGVRRELNGYQPEKAKTTKPNPKEDYDHLELTKRMARIVVGSGAVAVQSKRILVEQLGIGACGSQERCC